VLAAGKSRREIARTLSTARANGLLSEDTFLRRVDQLEGALLIDPTRFVGDLNLRSWREAWRSRATRAMTQGLGAITRAAATGPPPPGTLLALDWTGAQSELLIGRHLDCDVVFTDTAVSRFHARLRFRDGRWILQDLESTNGTTVNGERVGRSELRAGDVLLIGTQRLTID
jgi:FHA domain